jgi:beta-aspartyl-peptidase (threonine type)
MGRRHHGRLQLQAGAVNSVRYVEHPISLARAVMERSPHVYMAGVGALD